MFATLNSNVSQTQNLLSTQQTTISSLTTLVNQQASTISSLAAQVASLGSQPPATMASLNPSIVCNNSTQGVIMFNQSNFLGCAGLAGGWRLLDSLSGGLAGFSTCVTPRSCYEILLCQPGSLYGRYTITPAAGQSFSAYCDMTTDGGGWTLIQRSAYVPLPYDGNDWNANLMSPDVNGKLSDAKINALRGLTGVASSVMRINTIHDPRHVYVRAQSNTWNYVNDGANFGGTRQECYAWTLASCTFQPLSGVVDTSSAAYPTVGNDCTRTFSYNPCWRTNVGGICVEAGSSCVLNGQGNHPITLWMTWTREVLTPSVAAVPTGTRSCREILFFNPGAADGYYTITPSGGFPFTAYCDMTTDGGGWVLFQRSAYAQLPYNADDWNLATLHPNSNGKLADIRINAIRTLSGNVANAVTRIITVHESRRVYTRGQSSVYSFAVDGGNFGGTRQECYATSMAACTWNVASNAVMDTLNPTYPTVGNDCTRTFSHIPCWRTNTNGLCIEAGSSCVLNGQGNHPMTLWTAWIREQ